MAIFLLTGLSPRFLRRRLGWANDIPTLSSHGTTHLDAPWYYAPDSVGKLALTIDEVPLDWCFAPGVCIDMTHKKDGDTITEADITGWEKATGLVIAPGTIVLIRSGMNRLLGDPAYVTTGPWVTRVATHCLLQKGVKVTGTGGSGSPIMKVRKPVLRPAPPGDGSFHLRCICGRRSFPPLDETETLGTMEINKRTGWIMGPELTSLTFIVHASPRGRQNMWTVSGEFFSAPLIHRSATHKDDHAMDKPTFLNQKGFPFVFDATACTACGGHCCNGESGNIWVTRREIGALAEALGMDVPTFAADCLKKVGYRYSIGERCEGENYACLLFDEKKRGCSVYEARPAQCRSFPFWDYFRERPDEAVAECPGVILQRKTQAQGLGERDGKGHHMELSRNFPGSANTPV